MLFFEAPQYYLKSNKMEEIKLFYDLLTSNIILHQVWQQTGCMWPSGCGLSIPVLEVWQLLASTLLTVFLTPRPLEAALLHLVGSRGRLDNRGSSIL